MSARKVRGGKIIPLITPWRGSPLKGSVLEAALQRGSVTRAEALLVWAKITQTDPHFFDTYPRDCSGPISDDEKVTIVTEMTAMLLEQVLS